MKSKASIKGHPIHPIVVAFPIAFFIGAFLSDLIFLFTARPVFVIVGKYLAIGGVVFALLAAIPGIIDYIYTVPPQSSAKKRATQHGLINVTVLLIFAFAVLLRSDSNVNFLIVVVMELAGVILLTIAGWLGGTLVHRNQIGVDHRYAGAGKWKEERLELKDGRAELKNLGDLKLNQMKLVHAGKKRIAIGKTESGYAAFDDFCTHRGGSLADGALICGTVQCPWHGSQFDVKTGAVKAGPAKENIKTYPVVNENNTFYLVVGRE